LFGHVKELTSAVKDRAGKFEAADKGTIFRWNWWYESYLLKPKYCIAGKYDYQSRSWQG
jgi:hypothetical protein